MAELQERGWIPTYVEQRVQEGIFGGRVYNSGLT